ncbi:flagellar basal body P-ring formation chaperone FlgA [Maridesulfovibrio hydrothermalis]|uniref:Flagella basal body P-ring formation protein FlgA n=1 Tax=Maridesulfovibrio hydrothermalis AM13 = DSM 14728 TaxID=1121451 RepID=L0RB59_9BACT|nr:flagellar basal body P-ring formation chaperone FlgA [Maridesulfovibrio hydrothermalis]CCO23984.1 Flagella basal body P-ring formation protein FlgA [Maridesulfovibrio hydrothermalis AM13 = DSM 14728]
MTMAGDIRKIRRLIMLLFIAAGITVFAAAPVYASKQNTDWRIKIKSAAVVNGPRVTLGDIAEFYGDLPPQTRADLSGVELWNAPSAGRRPVRVNRKKLRVILKHYLGELIGNCIIPSTLTLQTGGKVMSEEDLKRAVVKVLTPQAERNGGDYKFRDFKLPDHLFFNDSMDGLRVHLPRALKPGSNNYRIEIVSVDGRVLRQLSGSVFVDVWKPVPCPVRPLNRKELVTPDLITWKSKNMAHLGKRVWDGKGGPWRVKVPVGTGQPIMRSSIEPAPVISRGDKVTLMFKSKHLKLTVPVESLEDGGVGQTVTVRNLQSKRKLVGTVIDAQTVQVK